ncbi:AAA family ATPase [uncultured Bacteroides sp.]|jgi:DNA sulfur modification protein DndD|uniref:AAA family ATPase n=1 Tax=uncultured Bacteroides sp. TaxID=162156 RepID=UPI0025F6158E|nr:AAA family ATPase [uncultured Bacteroides sp.]
MRIESIEIHNFRQYSNLTFNFPLKAGKNDLHIIYAKNGVGKTNVLNAITWCLYDTEMHLGDKYTASAILNNGKVQEIRNCLSENGNAIGDAIVRVVISSNDGSEKISFERVGKFNVTKDAVTIVESKFNIMHFTGEWNAISDEEEKMSMVKKNIPEEIHEYIFFDGEHLENYFKAGQSENIKNGIEELTQAKILEKTEEAFNNYLTRVLNPQIASSSQKDIAQAQKELDSVQRALDSSNASIEELTKQIHQCDDQIADLENIISGHTSVSDKTAKLKEIEKDIERVKADIDKKNVEMMKFAREYFQYFALYPSIKSLYKYIKEENEQGKLPPRIDKFLLDSIQEHKHCCICDQDLGNHSFKFIQDLKKELEVSTSTSALLNRSVSNLHRYLTKLADYQTIRDRLIQEKKDLDGKNKKLIQEETKLNRYLMNIPNTEAITKAIQQKKEFCTQRDNIIAKRGVEEAHKKELEKQLAEKESNLTSLIEKNNQFEKIREQAYFCKQCRNILRETRFELLEESRHEMENETFNTFTQLLWKKDAFSKVEILEDYTFKLLDNYGSQTLGSCSAAERALLALSFTLALQKVSMHDSLLFIDTPIGRVDEDNRINFVNTLCEIAKSKQVILTFTPTEYDPNVTDALQGQYASFNQLNMNEGVTHFINNNNG